MELQDFLLQLGLNKKEAQIYLACLELGPATANDVSKKTGLYRTYFYDLAKKLVDMSILKQTKKGKKTFFTAADPEELLKIEENKLSQLKKIIPQLKAINNTKGAKPKIYYYEGRAGIDEINNDTLRYQSEIVGFTTPRFYTADQKKLSNDYIKKRVSLGNKVRVIGELCQEVLDRKKNDKDELRQTRMLPKDLFQSEVEIAIYANKAYIINYKSEFGIMIEDKNIAEVLKQIFELAWNSGRIVE